MQIEVKLPEELEEGGDVLDIFVNVGDEIEADQGIVEIETDKATVEVPSSHAGKITAIQVKEGETLPAGGTILVLEVAATAKAAEPAAPTPEPQAKEEAKPKEQPAAEPEPAAAAPSPSQPKPATPPAAQPAAPTPPAETPPTPAPAAPEPASAPLATRTAGHAPAGPAVRRFAREVGVDINTVSGSGANGRITRDDVLAVVRQVNTTGSSASTATAAAEVEAAPADPKPAAPEKAQKAEPPGETTTDNWGVVNIQKMSKIRKTIANKMHESWSTCPRVTNFDDADVTSLEAMRQASKADYAESGIKLTTMPFIIKAVALALKSNPLVNASVDMENGQIIYKQYINVGIAVDTDRGLVVPSLRQADQLSISAIARALHEIADNARSGNFAIEDLRGSTFTISNLGAIGGTYSTPIINTPEVAILLVGRARKLPVVINDEIAIRLMMPLSLSYDHRLVDGGAAARFLNEVIDFLSAPSRLLIAP